MEPATATGADFAAAAHDCGPSNNFTSDSRASACRTGATSRMNAPSPAESATTWAGRRVDGDTFISPRRFLHASTTALSLAAHASACTSIAPALLSGYGATLIDSPS